MNRAIAIAVGMLAAAAVVAMSAAASAAPLAESRFDTGNEGWAVVSTLGYSGPTTWTSTGGHPGGFIYGQDPDTGAFGFMAPSKFLGPKGAAYGGSLSFDVAALTSPQGAIAWVGIQGGNMGSGGAPLALIHYYDPPASAYPAWYGRSVAFTTAGWFNPSNNQPATPTQMLNVLSDLDGLVITAEFVEGLETDISGLDNVVMMPEPATMALLGLGLIGLVLRRKRA